MFLLVLSWMFGIVGALWLFKELTMGICLITKRLDGKIVLITGGNAGIGFETALDLAKRGATLIMASRDLKKGNEAVDKIKKLSKNDKIVYKSLDLSSQKDVKKFAKQVIEEYPQINYLINNAGMSLGFNIKKPIFSDDGFELTIATNYLGHVTLTEMLLPCLKAAAEESGENSRIVHVSSEIHFTSKIDVENYDFTAKTFKKYNSQKQYSDSKLAQILYSNELARRTKNDNIESVSLHPGAVVTEITRNLRKSLQIFIKTLFQIFGKNPWQGAQTTLQAVLTSENISGEYWRDCGKSLIYSRSHIGKEDHEYKFYHHTKNILNL